MSIITGFTIKPACLSCAENIEKEPAQKAVGRPEAHGFFVSDLRSHYSLNRTEYKRRLKIATVSVSVQKCVTP
jgi:hypothetical protein